MRNALYRLIRKSPLVKVLSAMIVGVTALMAVSTPVTAEPLAVIEQTVYRFQDTLEGVKVVHEFRIANKGKSELNIVNVRGG